MKIRISSLAIVLSVLLSCTIFSGCLKSNRATGGTALYSIFKLVSSASNLTLLDTSLDRTGLDSLFNNGGPFTIFVATDTAWATVGLNASVVNSLPDSQLRKIVLYNTLSGSTLSAQLPAGPDASATTLSGDSVFISNSSRGVFVNGVSLVVTDLMAKNGVIDAMNQQLLPPSGALIQIIQTDTSFGYFSAAIARTSAGQTNVTQILSNGSIYTIFLPTNDAFRTAGYTTVDSINNADPDSLARILTYHIVPGRVFTSDFATGPIQNTLLVDSTINLAVLGGVDYTVQGLGNIIAIPLIKPNIMAHNGVLHVIGQLLFP